MIVYSILIFFLTLIYALFFLFYLAGWLGIKEYQKSKTEAEIKVSVVVAVRNESNRIANLLKCLKEQRYPEHLFEVIVVDDFSDDNSADVVEHLKSNNIQLVKMKDVISSQFSGVGNEALSSKKKSIEAGISRASGDLIITTDADCKMDDRWLKTIVDFFQCSSCCMAVAPVLMDIEKGFFNKLLQLDAIGMAGISGATLQNNFPTMCNGANLSFLRSKFYEVGGYAGNEKISSGDDMFLMHKFAKQFPSKVLYLKDANAIVYTSPPTGFKEFVKQRIRWTSKSKSFSDWKIKANLALVLLFNISILISVISMFFFHDVYLLLLFQLGVKLVVDFSFQAQTAFWFNRQYLLWLFLPAEFFHVFYIVTIGVAGNIFTADWKGRKIQS